MRSRSNPLTPGKYRFSKLSPTVSFEIPDGNWGAYRDYLDGRQRGAPRRFFSNRSHALNFLESVAPTKLVDGAWLFGSSLPQRSLGVLCFDDDIIGTQQRVAEQTADRRIVVHHENLGRHVSRCLPVAGRAR